VGEVEYHRGMKLWGWILDWLFKGYEFPEQPMIRGYKRPRYTLTRAEKE
jgi:hypothetical protein